MVSNEKRFRRPFARVALVLALASSGALLADSFLDPTTYRSPSGRYELFVDPSAANGSGPARYRLTRDGVEVWAGERPFSLWRAKVLDSGVVAGYAYERGADPPSSCGIGVMGQFNSGVSGLSVCILDPDGTVRTRDTDPLGQGSETGVRSGPSDSPSVLGMLADLESDRFVLRVPTDPDSYRVAWWAYRPSTGERLADLDPELPLPEAEGSRTVIQADFVPGTPLILVHSCLERGVGITEGRSASLTLLGADGRRIWELDFPGEYAEFERWWHSNGSFERLATQLSIGSRRFDFRSFGRRAKLSFAIERAADSEAGWHVVQTGRAEGIAESEPPVISLPKIRRVELEPSARSVSSLRRRRSGRSPGSPTSRSTTRATSASWPRATATRAASSASTGRAGSSTTSSWRPGPWTRPSCPSSPPSEAGGGSWSSPAGRTAPHARGG